LPKRLKLSRKFPGAYPMNRSFFSLKTSLLMLFISIGVIVVIFFQGIQPVFPSFNNPHATPTNILFTNVSDTSFTVTWFTDKKATGSVLLTSNSGEKKVHKDERDIGHVESFTSHSVLVRSLEPDTRYSVIIVSNGSRRTSG